MYLYACGMDEVCIYLKGMDVYVQSIGCVCDMSNLVCVCEMEYVSREKIEYV